MKKAFGALLLVLGLPGLACASEFGQGPTYTMPAGQVVSGNLYAAGGTLNLLGSVGKDTIVGGGNVFISGTTSANLMAAGGSVVVTSPVGSDARLAGGNISIDSPIGGELLVAAGNLQIGRSTIVGSDSYIAGNEIMISGAILGGAKIVGQQVTINGTIGRNVSVRAQKIVIGPQANIGGNFIYQAAEPAQIAATARIAGETKFTKISAPERYSWGNTLAMLGLTWLLKLIATIVAVLVIFFLFPKRVAEVAEVSADNFWSELLRGLIIMVVTPIALFILFLSLVGWLLALIGVFVYITLLIVAAPMSVFVAAGLLQRHAFKDSVKTVNWPRVLLAAVILFVLGLIPFVGWIIAFGIYLAALGATARAQYISLR